MVGGAGSISEVRRFRFEVLPGTMRFGSSAAAEVAVGRDRGVARRRYGGAPAKGRFA